MRTAESIEQTKAEKDSGEKPKKDRRGTNPNSLKNLMAPWTPETRPNSPGRPRDTASDISRKAFEANEKLIYERVVKQIMDSAYGFEVHANRAFGKLTDKQEFGDKTLAVLEKLSLGRKRAQERNAK